MDLNIGPQYEAFRAEVKAFLAAHGHLAPAIARPRDDKSKAWQRLLIEHGYTARTIPAQYGGAGLEPDILKSRIIAEEFALARVSPGSGRAGHFNAGTDAAGGRHRGPEAPVHRAHLERRYRLVPGVFRARRGKRPGGAWRTRAVLDGDHWVINGQKIWTSTAHLADWIFCLVRTEPVAPEHRGISFLLFRMDTPGIEIRPLVDMTMKRNFNEVFFTDVRVPKDQIVGRRGDGWMVANVILKT